MAWAGFCIWSSERACCSNPSHCFSIDEGDICLGSDAVAVACGPVRVSSEAAAIWDGALALSELAVGAPGVAVEKMFVGCAFCFRGDGEVMTGKDAVCPTSTMWPCSWPRSE